MRKLLIAVVIVVLVGGVAAIVVTRRPELTDARNSTVTAWAPIIRPLNVRYQQLTVLLTLLNGALIANGVDNQVVAPLKTSVAAWDAVSQGTDAARMVEVANTIEAQVGQLRAVLGASARLNQAASVTTALTAFDATAPPALSVAAYNTVVLAYEKKRTSSLGRLVAQLFGYAAIPTFQPSTTASQAPSQP